MAEQLQHHDAALGSGEETDDGEETEASPSQHKCCWCLSPRVGAVFVCILVSIANTLFIAMCLYLLFNKEVSIRFVITNEKFNYVFMATINSIMLVSNFLILRGAWTQQQRYVMVWIFIYAVMVFLQNVVGIAAFVQAMVDHADAWTAVPFILMIILDGLYIYCIMTVHTYCRTLEGYSVFP